MSSPGWISDDPFPPVEQALVEPNGLLAAGGDLSPERLLDAYARGIFPWFNDEDPVLWWSPDPRMVLFPRELHVSQIAPPRRFGRGRFTVTFDRAFEAVMEGCAGPRPKAGRHLDHRGHDDGVRAPGGARLAHSVETWADGELVGGLYGVALGRIFYGESMFSRRSDASKVALAYLARQLDRWSFRLIDCQMATETPRLARRARDSARRFPAPRRARRRAAWRRRALA